jgi:plasmid maintenance system killer protein
MTLDVSQLTGMQSGFNYTILPTEIDHAILTRYCNDTRMRYASLTKNWSNELNTQWHLRMYLSVKYLLAATVMAASAEYTDEQKVLVAVPYLNYYAILNCCRAFLYTVPDLIWKGQSTIEATHNSILNSTSNNMRRLIPDFPNSYTKRLRMAQAQREIFSYRFPASGPAFFENWSPVTVQEAIHMCSLLAEVAQLNSECLSSSLNKNAPGPYLIVGGEGFELCSMYEGSDFDDVDYDDAYRSTKYAKHGSKPLCLYWTATEGLVEDFFGSWCAEENAPEYAFNIDQHWRIIFPFM